MLVQDPSLPGPISAPLYFVSPGQINFQIPFEVVRSSVTVTVSTAQGASQPYTINLDAVAPGLFSATASGTGDALVFDGNFSRVLRTPDAGSTFILYATGLGATTPAAVSGMAGRSAAPFNVASTQFDVYVGGKKATVVWVGLAPGFVGVYQINVVAPAVAVGDVYISGPSYSESNHLHMPQAPLNSGNNTMNVTGSVEVLYPAGQPTISFSTAFVVASVKARFDTKPNADRFTLTLTAKVGSTAVDGTEIQFDPVLKKFTANVPSPSPYVRNFDFSMIYPTIVVRDFLCPGTCPVPGNVIPKSRVDAALVSAMTEVPLANTQPNGIHSFYTVTGDFTAGSNFALDSNTNRDLRVFASFGSLSYPTAPLPVSVSLYIDGHLIDTATATYKNP